MKIVDINGVEIDLKSIKNRKPNPNYVSAPHRISMWDTVNGHRILDGNGNDISKRKKK